MFDKNKQMSRIKSEVDEIKAIDRELKNLRERGAALRKRKVELEASIADFLKSKEQIGVQDGDSNIILDEKLKVGHKKAKDKDSDALSVLKKYGIRHADDVLKEILEARRGEPTTVTKIKIQRVKK